MMLHATKRRFKDCPGFHNSTGRLGPKRGRKCYNQLAELLVLPPTIPPTPTISFHVCHHAQQRFVPALHVCHHKW